MNPFARLICWLGLALHFVLPLRGGETGIPGYQAGNQRLKELYSELSTRKQPLTVTEFREKCQLLENGLDAYGTLQPAFDQNRTGWKGLTLQKQARCYAACAWLHAWGSFNLLITSEVATQLGEKPDEMRQGMLLEGQDRKATFRSLWELFARISQACPPGETNPIGASLSLFQEAGLGSLTFDLHPDFFRDGTTAFSNSFLLGASNKSWDRVRSRLPLWSLVNLQLDTWQSYSVDDKGEVTAVSFVRPNHLGQWLKTAASITEECHIPNAGILLAQPCRKMASYLAFREEWESDRAIRDGKSQRALLRSFQTDRIGAKGTDPLLFISANLLDAARPLDNGDVLFDAAIWLRHLVLLSYQGEPSAVAGKGPNALPTIWDGYFAKLDPARSVFAIQRSTGQQAGGEGCRWNSWPIEGSLEDVLADCDYASEEICKIQAILSSEQAEAKRLSGLTNRSARDEYTSEFVEPNQKRTSELAGRFTALKSAARASERLRNLHRTATTNEQERAREDLTFLEDQADVRENLLTLTLRSIRAANRVGPGMPAVCPDPFMGGESWSIPAVPSHSFGTARKELEKGIARLSEAIAAVNQNEKDANESADLLANFQIRQKDLTAAEHQFAAVVLGREAAAKAHLIAEQYASIHKFDVEISELDRRIADLQEAAASNNLEAKQRQAAYQRQQVDLAQARLQGVEQAYAQVKQLIAETESSLSVLSKQLDSEANQLQAAEKRSGLFGILKSVVNVAGLALAPFTEGASLGVAAAINQGIGVIQRGKPHNLSELASDLAGLGSATAQATGTSLDIPEWKNASRAELKEALGACHRLLTSADAPDSLIEKAKPLLDSIKAAGPGMNGAVSALASGFPLHVTGGRIAIDFSEDHKVVLSNPRLTACVSGIFQAQGFLANDAETRLKYFAKLVDVPESKLRAELATGLESGIRLLPAKLQQAGLDTELFKKSRDELLHWVKDEKTPIAECRALSSALATGMTLIEQGDKVLAVLPPMENQYQALMARVEAAQTTKFSEVLENADSQLKAFTKELSRRISEAQGNKDAGTLKKLAQQVSETEIPRVKGILKSVSDKIKETEGALEDQKNQNIISGYEMASAQALVEIASLTHDKLAIGRDRLALEGDILTKKLFQEADLLEGSKEEVAAAEMACSVASGELKRAYFSCIQRGFDPFSSNPKVLPVEELYSRKERLRLSGVFPRLPESGHDGLIALRQHAAMKPMLELLQWYQISGASSEGESTPESLLSGLYARFDKPEEFAKYLRFCKDCIEKALDETLKEKNGTGPKIDAIVADITRNEMLRITPENRELILGRRLFSQKSDDIPLAAFSINVGDVSPDLPFGSASSNQSFKTDEGHRWYVITTECGLFQNGTKELHDLRYAILPPMVTPALWESGRELNSGRIYTAQIEKKLDNLHQQMRWSNPSYEYCGAEGQWQVVIFGSNPEELERADLKVFLPYVEIRNK